MDMLTSIILELAIGGFTETAFSARLPKAIRFIMLVVIFVVLVSLTVFFGYMSVALLPHFAVSITCAIAALLSLVYTIATVRRIQKAKKAAEKQVK